MYIYYLSDLLLCPLEPQVEGFPCSRLFLIKEFLKSQITYQYHKCIFVGEATAFRVAAMIGEYTGKFLEVKPVPCLLGMQPAKGRENFLFNNKYRLADT